MVNPGHFDLWCVMGRPVVLRFEPLFVTAPWMRVWDWESAAAVAAQPAMMPCTR